MDLTVDERDVFRADMLDAMYEADLDQNGSLLYEKWADARGFDLVEARRAARWHADHDYGIMLSLGGGDIAITPAGRDLVEERRRKPPESAAGIQAELTISELRKVEPALAEIRSFIENNADALDPETREDLTAQVETVEAQLRSPRPRRGVVGAALAAAKWTADHAGGELVGAGAMATLQAVVHLLS